MQVSVMPLNRVKRTALADDLEALRGKGITFAEISSSTGINRSSISQYVNNGMPMHPDKEARLRAYVEERRNSGSQMIIEEAIGFKTSIELFPTLEFQEAIGWCTYIAEKRKMGVLVGPPGSGKTTILRQFAKQMPGAAYIEIWPSMRMGDLLEILGRVAGVSPRGNNYRKAQEITQALQMRDDVVLLIDEAEYLRKWDVDKFEILRKIWDNSGTPIIFCGTQALETILTRGGGKDNLAQLYRRKYEIVLKGIKEPEVRQILKSYNTTKEAQDMLTAIAIDSHHGGMGNFVEILDLCLESAQGGQIDASIVREAKQFKLLY